MKDVIFQMKRDIITLVWMSGEGHIASSFSVLDIIWVLYSQIMKEDDLFILSKGHASLALYAVLRQVGILTDREFYSYCRYESILGGHPDMNKVPGVVASTGSLGHGLPMAVGIAWAQKIQKYRGRVFCLIGDGEMNEGTIWESLLLADTHKLNNLQIIVDYNHSNDESVNIEPIANKVEGFNLDWDIMHGHSHGDIAYQLNYKGNDRPRLIIADTIKGYGCKTMVDNPREWHHKKIDHAQAMALIEELR
jgi:transketolase